MRLARFTGPRWHTRAPAAPASVVLTDSVASTDVRAAAVRFDRATMTMQTTTIDAHVGDWVETRAIRGGPGRRGEVVAVLGRAGHEHYRVRWDDQHESILYPADGVVLVRPAGRRRPAR